MNSSASSKLSRSWVVNTEDDGDISWDERSDLSDREAPAPSRHSPKTRQSRTSARDRAGSRTFAAETGPRFQMPSVESLSPQKSSQVSHQQRKASLHAKNQSANKRITSNQSTSLLHMSDPRKSRSNAVTMLLQVGEYGLDIAISTLKKLKQPISWALAAYLFAGLLLLVQNLVTSSISHALSPVCRIPGVSLLGLPICSFKSRYPSDMGEDDVPTLDAAKSAIKSARKKKAKGKPASTEGESPEFDTLMQVQSQFSTLIDASSSSVALSLPLDMKRSETSIRDLKQVVRFSTISSRNELVHEFDGFIETARIASYDLQKFNSHVGRAVDNVLSTTRWTGRALDEIATENSKRGLIPRFVQDQLLAPFQPLRFSENKVLEHYILHSRVVSDEIARLVDEATSLLTTLSNLEDRLDVIHGIALRDGIAAKANRDEVLSQLWTFLGGNKSKLGKVDSQLKLLGRVAEYRKMAYAHVSGTVVKLQAMGAELEELRSRVGAVELLRDSGKATIPLHVHLDAIRLGVERLEGQREQAREVERSHVRRVIDSSGAIAGGYDQQRHAGGDVKPLLVDA